MTRAERLALLRTAQATIRQAMAMIATAVAGTEAEDWGTVYTLLWLQKVVDHANPHADIGNLDDIMAQVAAEVTDTEDGGG